MADTPPNSTGTHEPPFPVRDDAQADYDGSKTTSTATNHHGGSPGRLLYLPRYLNAESRGHEAVARAPKRYDVVADFHIQAGCSMFEYRAGFGAQPHLPPGLLALCWKQPLIISEERLHLGKPNSVDRSDKRLVPGFAPCPR